MGQVWIFTADHSQFIGKAVNVERMGADRAACAAEAKAQQAAQMRELRLEGRRLKMACKPHKMVKRVLAKAKADHSTVVQMPRPSEPFTTPALDAIGVAMRSGQSIQASPVPPAQQAQIDALAAEMSAPKAPVVTISPKATQFKRAKELEAQIEAGLPVDGKDRAWLTMFQQHPIYLSMTLIAEDFGVDVAMTM